MTFRKACITGGAGFIGSRLARRLLRRNMAVTILDNLSVGSLASVPDGADLIPHDILSRDAVDQAMSGCDVVFHLAARVAIRSSFEFVVEDTMTNVAGTASILRAASQSATVRKIVSTSSMAVYSDAATPDPISEGHPVEPVSPYGISKLALERLTHSMAAVSGKGSVVLRLFNTYGSGQKLSPYVGVVTIFANSLLNGNQPVIYGDGNQCRDFVHVEDVVSAFVGAMDSDVTGETCNIGTAMGRTVNAVYESVRQRLCSDVPAAHQSPQSGELRYSVADIARARRLLNYQPVYRFEDSIGEVIDEIIAGHAGRTT